MGSLLNLKTDETTIIYPRYFKNGYYSGVYTNAFVLNNNDVSFFNMKFIKTTIFICLSILVYWLIIRRLSVPMIKINLYKDI